VVYSKCEKRKKKQEPQGHPGHEEVGQEAIAGGQADCLFER